MITVTQSSILTCKLDLNKLLVVENNRRVIKRQWYILEFYKNLPTGIQTNNFDLGAHTGEI